MQHAYIQLIFNFSIFEVIRGQWRSAWGHSFDLSLVWTYFHCNSAVFSFDLICNTPIFLVIVILTILEVKRSKKVIGGQIMVMRGHDMIKNSKMLVTYDILRCSASHDIHHAYVLNCLVLRSSEVSHLTSHLSGHIFIVILLSLAFIWYVKCLYSVDFQFFNFWGQKMEVKKLWPMIGGQTRSYTQKTMPDSENMGQNRGGWTSREAL